MSKRDAVSRSVLKTMIAPIAATDDTPLVSAIIDVRGAKSVLLGILTGILADAAATFTPLLEEGDDAALADAAAVADADMISQTSGTAPETAAAFTQAHDSQVRKLGYIGSKGYIRLTITPAGNASSAPIAAFAELELTSVPVTQPTS